MPIMEHKAWTPPPTPVVSEAGYPTMAEYHSYDAWIDRKLAEAQKRRHMGMEYISSPERFAHLSLEERQELAQLGLSVVTPPPTPAKPTGELTPWWMPQYVPGQVVGQPWKKLPISTFSPQLWASTPAWMQRELSRYGEWSGYPLEDVISEMGRMLPKEPRGLGWGGARWQPIRQRA